MAASSGGTASGIQEQPLALNVVTCGTATGIQEQPLALSGTNRVPFMDELNQMRRLACWGEFLALLDRNAKVPMRQVLSHHGSLPCLPKEQKSAGPWQSLKACGLDTILDQASCAERPNPGCSCSHCAKTPLTKPKCFVRLKVPNMFVNGDGLQLVYESRPWSTKVAAQHHACWDILAFLLVVGPDAVHVHPSTMVDIERVREEARAVRERFLAGAPLASDGAQYTCACVPANHDSRLSPPPRAQRLTSYYPPLAVKNTQEQLHPAPRAERLASYYQPLAVGETQEQRDRQVLHFLSLSLTPQRWHDPSRLDYPVRMFLACRVQPRTLKEVLMRNPHACSVRNAGAAWEFSLAA